MAGLLYLPRLFVYHAEAEVGGDRSETLKVMERKLLHYIMRPAALVAVLAGAAMAPQWLADGKWLHVKILLVFVMGGFHTAMAFWYKDFARDANRHSPRFFKIMNEGPTLLMIAIVILVITKPF